MRGPGKCVRALVRDAEVRCAWFRKFRLRQVASRGRRARYADRVAWPIGLERLTVSCGHAAMGRDVRRPGRQSSRGGVDTLHYRSCGIGICRKSGHARILLLRKRTVAEREQKRLGRREQHDKAFSSLGKSVGAVPHLNAICARTSPPSGYRGRCIDQLQ